MVHECARVCVCVCMCVCVPLSSFFHSSPPTLEHKLTQCAALLLLISLSMGEFTSFHFKHTHMPHALTLSLSQTHTHTHTHKPSLTYTNKLFLQDISCYTDTRTHMMTERRKSTAMALTTIAKTAINRNTTMITKSLDCTRLTMMFHLTSFHSAGVNGA